MCIEEKTICELIDTLPCSAGIKFMSIDRVQDVVSEPVQLSFETVDDMLQELDYNCATHEFVYCD